MARTAAQIAAQLKAAKASAAKRKGRGKTVAGRAGSTWEDRMAKNTIAKGRGTFKAGNKVITTGNGKTQPKKGLAWSNVTRKKSKIGGRVRKAK